MPTRMEPAIDYMKTIKEHASEESTFQRFLPLIEKLVAQGGPTVRDYPELDFWLADLSKAIRDGNLLPNEIEDIRRAFGRSMSSETMQGFALAKPHGYAGDFEIIDRIYGGHVCQDSELAAWDHYYHQHAAPKAVRNRKLVFHRLLDHRIRQQSACRILKIAVGPGRSMFEWLKRNPDADVSIECVEMDPEAVSYAKRLNREFLDRIQFHEKNALRFRPEGTFDLIWIAGLFDYFNDRTFVRMVRRLAPAIAEGGELVIGNFSDRNPSRPYMEILGGWNLHHRSAEHLFSLAGEAGIPKERIEVYSEPEAVNLFLHIRGATRAGETVGRS